MVLQRKQPYVRVTWLKNHLIGNRLCKWSVWHKIFYDFKYADSDFDSVKWKMDHTAMLNKVIKYYASAGYEVIPELPVNVPGQIAILKGKIDLVALNEERSLIIEVKTGNPNPADKVQLLIYLWAIGRSSPRFRGVRFDGLLIYENHEEEISSLEIDESFVKNFYEFMQEITSGEPDRKYPNKYECLFCEIRDCDERIEKEELEESDYISPYF